MTGRPEMERPAGKAGRGRTKDRNRPSDYSPAAELAEVEAEIRRLEVDREIPPKRRAAAIATLTHKWLRLKVEA